MTDPLDPRAADERSRDLELLRAVRGGEPGAFDRFVGRFSPMILAFGLRMCGHRQDAEDVFQETLVKLYTQLRTLEEPGALRTWIWRVVANECLMSRRGRRNPARSIGLDDLGGSRADGPAFQLADTGAESPEQAVLRLETRERIERALGHLAPDYRIIVLLRDFEGLTTEEVAEVLGISAANAKVRLHRARNALRKQLVGADPGEARP